MHLPKFNNISFKSLYHRLVKINDSPQKIALGFALGVFFGIFPGIGPLAAFVLASLLHINAVAAFIGGLATNTWISVVTFVFAAKLGATVTGADWQKILDEFKALKEQFAWENLWDISFLEIIYP